MRGQIPWIMLLMSTSFIAVGCGNKESVEQTVKDVATPIRRTTEAVQPSPEIKKQIDGREALRFETFGNEGFWNDVVKLPLGMRDKKVTPLQALKLGLSINSEAIDKLTLENLTAEIQKDGEKSKLLNDPTLTMKLMNANAFIGIVVKDTNKDGIRDVLNGDKAGVSCVLCHAVASESTFGVKDGGSIGNQIDGPAAHKIQLGKLFALAANTKGFYPMAQLHRSGRSVGRAPSYSGLFTYFSEADYDAYFSNPKNYPAGAFDDTLDGIGNPVHNSPLFRQDLAAPYGSAGEMETFTQYANTMYTMVLDPTVLVTDNGRLYLNKIMGPMGDKLAKDYLEILEEIGIRKYSYIKSTRTGEPGTPETIVGIGVDKEILEAIEVYVKSLRAPQGVMKDIASVEKGKMVFQDTKNQCLTCHNTDHTLPVKNDIIDMKVIFPGDSASVFGKRPIALPMLNTSGRTYDDKMITMNASIRGKNRGIAVPLLMDLARKPKFLHDGSVDSLEKLFDSGRGSKAPHPFYVSKEERLDLKAYLESLDDTVK